LPFLFILVCYCIFRTLLFGTSVINLSGYSVKIYKLKYLASDFIRLYYPLSHCGHFSVVHRCAGALGSAAIIVIGAIYAKVYRAESFFRLIVFGLLWQVITLAALYNNFGFAVFPSRFLYIPSIGVCIALGASLWAIYLCLPMAPSYRQAIYAI